MTPYAAPALPDDEEPASGPAHRARTRRRTPIAVIAGGVVAVALAVTVSIITLDDPPSGEGVSLGTPTAPPVQITADSGLGTGTPSAAPTSRPPTTPPASTPTGNDNGSVTTAVEAEDALLGGAAEVLAEPAASGGRLVHQIGTDQAGNSGQLVFNEVTVARASRYALTVAYVTGEDRNALLAVNGERPLLLRFPSSGGWSTVATQTFTIELRAGRNRLAFSNPAEFAPRIDKIDILG